MGHMEYMLTCRNVLEWVIFIHHLFLHFTDRPTNDRYWIKTCTRERGERNRWAKHKSSIRIPGEHLCRANMLCCFAIGIKKLRFPTNLYFKFSFPVLLSINVYFLCSCFYCAEAIFQIPSWWPGHVRSFELNKAIKTLKKKKIKSVQWSKWTWALWECFSVTWGLKLRNDVVSVWVFIWRSLRPFVGRGKFKIDVIQLSLCSPAEVLQAELSVVITTLDLGQDQNLQFPP